MLFLIKFGIVVNLEYPDDAALVDPLCGKPQRGKKGSVFCPLSRLQKRGQGRAA